MLDPVSEAGDMPWIVALGGHALNGGLEQVARRLAARVLVIDWNDAPPFRGDRHLQLDIKQADDVVAAVRSVVGGLVFAYTSSDVATETAARINAEYGLRRPAAEALAVARHKPSMNRRWHSEGLLQKRFRVCGEVDEFVDFHRAGASRSIIKPAAAASSRGVTVIERSDGVRELQAAFARASASDPAGEVLVEEFVEGTEFSVEMVGDGHGHVEVLAVGRRHPSANAGRNRVAAKIHYNPPEVSADRQRRIADFARRCFLALGLRSSLGHIELIERPDGVLVPLELGARSSGFIATHLVDAVTVGTRTMLELYERALQGERVEDGLAYPRRSSMLFFYDFPTGVGRRSGTGLGDFLPAGIESVAHDRSELVSGRSFGQIDGDAERPGFEILISAAGTFSVEVVAEAESAHRLSFLDPAPPVGGLRRELIAAP
jgi:formate-dependent phosphoribosylglycinamide formyltransferase (GAR transformylase)